MILYLDTSALVKLYIKEKDSNKVKGLLSGAEAVSTSRIAYVEAKSAFARKLREGELSKKSYGRVIKAFDEEWEKYFLIEVSEEVTRLAGHLVERYPLRGYDAVHLASAIILQKKTDLPVTFLCFDIKLEDSARKEKLLIP